MTDPDDKQPTKGIITHYQDMPDVIAAYPRCDALDHDAPAPNELALGGCSNPNCLGFKGHIFDTVAVTFSH
jgi:hypothetical protein